MQELARPIPTVLASLGPRFKFQMPMSSSMTLSKSLHLGHRASVSSSSEMCGILGTTRKINAQDTLSSFLSTHNQQDFSLPGFTRGTPPNVSMSLSRDITGPETSPTGVQASAACPGGQGTGSWNHPRGRMGVSQGLWILCVCVCVPLELGSRHSISIYCLQGVPRSWHLHRVGTCYLFCCPMEERGKEKR